jgi:hypothetical protein
METVLRVSDPKYAYISHLREIGVEAFRKGHNVRSEDQARVSVKRISQAKGFIFASMTSSKQLTLQSEHFQLQDRSNHRGDTLSYVLEKEPLNYVPCIQILDPDPRTVLVLSYLSSTDLQWLV